MNAIEVKNLTKKLGSFTLDNISFNLPSGTILGLVGENGAGKTTAIKLIMNSFSADSGSVSVLGADNTSAKFKDIKQDIGVVLDEAYFPEALTADNINKVMKNSYKNWNEEVYYAYIKQFSLPSNKQFKDFSRGMKMKLNIAVALSHDPKLLILDEATGGLDPMVRDEILDVFNEFTRDEAHSIILSSHIVSDLEKICDYIAFIHKGKLVLCEEKDAILETYAIVKTTDASFTALTPQSIVNKRKTAYGYDVLVLTEKISPAFILEKTTLEDIILFMAKED